MTTTERSLLDHIISECSKIDREARFDEMLDECYSFASVGGIFAYMCPSRVLKEMDPVAYRCGVNDFEDSEDWIEIDGDYYDGREVDAARDEFVAELEREAEEIERELDEEMQNDEPDGEEVATLTASLNAKRAEISTAESYAF